MPAKANKYNVVRPFDRVDPKTGKEAHFKAGDSYSGDDIDKYLDYDGGPLISADGSGDSVETDGTKGNDVA